MSGSVAIIGYSGHAYVVIETAKKGGITISGYCEVSEREINPYNLHYLGNETSETFNWSSDLKYFIGIGDNVVRNRIAEHVQNRGGEFVKIIHPSAWISPTAKISNGTFVSASVSVNAMTHIGDQCILNTGCIIEHEGIIGHTVHIGPGAVLAGNVRVGNNTFVGANAVIKQGVTIGENVIIGAGSVVIRDVVDGEIIAGNPAKRIK